MQDAVLKPLAMNWEFWLDPVKTSHSLWRQLLCCSTFGLVTRQAAAHSPDSAQQPRLSLGPGGTQGWLHGAPLTIMGSSYPHYLVGAILECAVFAIFNLSNSNYFCTNPIECRLTDPKALLGLWERGLRWCTNMYHRQKARKVIIFPKPVATIKPAPEPVPAPLLPRKPGTALSFTAHRRGQVLSIS